MERVPISDNDQQVEGRRSGERRLTPARWGAGRGDRRREPRRETDRRHARLHVLSSALWALIGAVVVLYLFYLAVGGVNPSTARAATIVVLILAVLWFAHYWRRVVLGGSNDRSDRERRGF